ncbi:hypothetical protein [Pseudogemmobacter faecipullorum]|uniref:Lipoprotein n=1 Tax=Pseudogemmobacter faecipullorum TaxID=2755041 RepID=A0ABS8CKB3_9RHOB|nr:hypothetical protein [Pseudogemmobacter faecipullorum]MCB5409834.1 hypothetical protein [Pseudogemmobacter faecipullorum]
MAAFLGACVAGNGGQGAGGAGAVAGSYQASVKGNDFSGKLRPGAAGKRLTASGARAVTGHAVLVRGVSLSLGQDRGLLAKEGARALCQQAGGRFEETALGQYQAPSAWIFRGGCA